MIAVPASADSEALDFLRLAIPQTGGFNLVAIDPDGPRGNNVWARAFTPDTVERAADFLEQYGRRKCNLYWSVNPLKTALNKKAEKTDVAALAWLHVDIDDTADDVLERVRAYRPPPTCIIFSGGGYQAFWRLEEPVAVNGSAEPLEDFNRYIEKHFGADHCHNIDRIMRVPGTTNWPNAKKREKGREPTQARLVEFHEERRYELADFTPLAKEQVNREEPETITTRGRGAGGDDRSADLLRRVGADVRAELPDYQIIAKHREHPHARDQSDPERAVRRCIQRARTEHRSTDETKQSDNAPVVKLRSAAEIVATPTKAEWLIADVFEAFAIAIMFGDLGTFKSFLALCWSLHIASGRAWLDRFKIKAAACVVYIHAEGRGLDKRIRGWCSHHGVDVGALKFYAVEHLLDLSDGGLTNLVEAIDALGIKPALIVIDTLSRNCGPLDEDRSKDMAPFINRLDASLRVRYGASVLLVHHTGHGAKDRTRGTYVLLANTDSNYRIARPDKAERIIEITTGRLKDAESPEPIYVIGEVVDLGTVDGNGKPESTLVLVPTHSRPAAPMPDLKSKAAREILAALRKRNCEGKIWTLDDMRAIGRELNQHKNTARSAVETLAFSPFMTPTVGGYRLNE